MSKATKVGKMVPSNYEYFSEEQHNLDMKNIVSKKDNVSRIIGKIKGNWLDDLDMACKLADKVLYTQREHHSDYLYETVLSDKLPTLSKIPQLIGFKSTDVAQVQMQRPGCVFASHHDPIEIFINPHRVRVLVTLAPWEHGQIIMFNNTIFQHWEAGTILYTNFGETIHATFNGSHHTRPLLQITGEPSDQLQDIINGNNEQIFQL